MLLLNAIKKLAHINLEKGYYYNITQSLSGV
jgi:hypothetical protein